MGITNTALFEFNNILEEEYADKEVFDKPGEFWYFTKHGIGPGSVPRDINIEKIIEGDGGEYFLVKDKILSTSALNKYEIKERVPKNISEEYSLVGQDGNAFSLMGYTARCMRKCGFKKADIDEMRERAMSGDYNNLIVVCDEYIQKCNDTLDNDTLDYDDLTEGYHSFNWHGQVNISVHDNDPKWPDEYICQVSEIHPYDDADYAWAKKDSPVSAKIIQSNKVIDTIQLPEWDDDSFEDENEYYNDVIDIMTRAIRQINKDVESNILYDSLSIKNEDMYESYKLNESIQYEENVFYDGLDKIHDVGKFELNDGFTFKSKYNLSNKSPYKIIISPFSSYDDAVDFCEVNNIDSTMIQETDDGDIFVKYRQKYKISLIGYIVDCEINQYEGKNITNTFEEFPLNVKGLFVSSSKLTNKSILKAAQQKYNINMASNTGVSRKSLHVKDYVFKVTLADNTGLDESL